MNQKVDIKDLLKEELTKEITLLSFEPYRAGQVLDWVYKKGACDFKRMTNLSDTHRKTLREKFYISGLELIKQLVSKDGTMRFLFGLEDGHKIESVFIPSQKTNTVCVSSQVGCRFACRFCASGKAGFKRDLRPAEMVEQVLFLRRNKIEIKNVVFMGTGEPFDNYESVLKAIRIINAPYGLGIGQRRITISTCGIPSAIRRFAKEGLQVELSVSLHSPDEKFRSELMSINNKFPIRDLMDACRDYIKETSRQITFEYVLIKGINDSQKDAEELSGLIKGMLAKVNLISFNPVAGLDYGPPEPEDVRRFKHILDKRGIVSTLRRTRGQDIEAACGQLRLQHDVIRKTALSK